MVWLKLKAGALQLTLFVAVVIALILVGFILLIHTHKQFSVQTDFIKELAQNANMGINESLTSHVTLNDTINLNLNNEGYKSVKVHREFWGVFEKVTSIATIKNDTFKQVALIGGIQPENKRTALYVQDNNTPLVVAGNTKIEGVVYVSKGRVKTGIISRQSYHGSQLIYGLIRPASVLPSLLKETMTQLELIEKQISKTQSSDFIELENGKTFVNSFFNTKQVVFSNSEIRLSNVNLLGNIVIQSKTKIIVEASSALKDVLLIAPEIEIADYVTGNFQAIASKDIYIGKEVILEYPSAMVLREKEIYKTNGLSESLSQNKIFIDEYSTLRGVVVFVSETQTNNYAAQIEITENATVVGEVYCSENIELKGSVYGTVFTNNFISRQSGLVYQNHVYNGKIIVNNLPQEFVGLSFKDSKKGVLEWLY